MITEDLVIKLRDNVNQLLVEIRRSSNNNKTINRGKWTSIRQLVQTNKLYISINFW